MAEEDKKVDVGKKNKPKTFIAVHDHFITKGTVEIEYVDVDESVRKKEFWVDAETMREFNLRVAEVEGREATQDFIGKFFSNKDKFNADTLVG